MTTFNAIIKKRNTDNTDWDSILPITTADNVLMNAQGETVADKFVEIDSIIANGVKADGGNAATVNGKTVEANVPAGAKFTDTVYVHPNDANTRHVSDSQIANWNGKANGSHTHPASQVTAGTLPVGVTATNGTDYGTSRVRNISAGTADLTPGVSALASGAIYIVYE